MDARSLRADEELLADLAVGEAGGDEREDLTFSFAQLDTLFHEQNQSSNPGTTRIPATFLRVTVDV